MPLFDPLSLYTAKADDTVTDQPENLVPSRNWQSDFDDKSIGNEYTDDDEIPLHILDLPILSLCPPFEVLYVIVKLLSVNEIWNFQQRILSGDTDEIFKAKRIDIKHIEEALPWLCVNCGRFNSKAKLSKIPMLSHSLQQSLGYNDWLTHIISSDLLWITTEQKHKLQTETSLRISENCGRTAQPEVIRKIKLLNMEVTGRDFITIKEPALTSDNLGLKTWGSSLMLGEKLLGDTQRLREPILELGAGTGLIGIILLLLKYSQVFITDLAEIIPNLKVNFKLNKVECIVDELDWNDPAAFLTKYPIQFNTIILSDPIYSPDHPELIHRVLKKVCCKDTDILIQVPLRRNYDDVRAKLWELLQDYELVEEYIKVGADEFGDVRYCFRKYKF